VRLKRSPLKVYGIFHLLWICLCALNTQIFFRGCQLVRLPVFIRGRRNIVFGPGFVCGYMTRLDAFGGPGCIRFGRNVEMNDFVHIGATDSITIGDDVMIASRVFITDHGHGIYDASPEASSPRQIPTQRVEPSAPVRIGDRVWIGEGVCILPGVTIGDGCVIGANAVVAKDIPPDSIAVGVPARVVKRWDESRRGWFAVEP
jgi:lipopolysaccharide O-acetyltransferase